MPNNPELSEDTETLNKIRERTRKLYCKPLLENLGHLHTITIGGSPGRNDSGTNLTAKPNVPGYFPPPDDPYLP